MLVIGSGSVAIAIAIRPDDGSFESGQVAASELARSLTDEAARYADEVGAC